MTATAPGGSRVIGLRRGRVRDVRLSFATIYAKMKRRGTVARPFTEEKLALAGDLVQRARALGDAAGCCQPDLAAAGVARPGADVQLARSSPRAARTDRSRPRATQRLPVHPERRHRLLRHALPQ